MKLEARSVALWLGGLVLVAAGGAWFVSATEWATRDVWEPPRGEAAHVPHFLLKQLATRVGARVQTRHQLDELPPDGATLLLESAYWHFLPQREQALRGWVERGGHLLVYRHVADDAALSDWVPVKFRAESRRPSAAAASAPAPARADPDEDDEDDGEDEDDAPAAAPAKLPQRQPPCPPLAEPTPQPGWYGPARQYRVCARGESLLSAGRPPLWSVADEKGTRALRLPIGRGSVTLSGRWEAPQYSSLLNGDQALLFAAMAQLRPGQHLWIVDDEHHAGLLATLWQAAPAAAVLAALALALLLWRWSVRLAPLRAADALARRSMAEQVRGTAAYLLRHGPAALHRAQWRALDEAAQSRLHGWRHVAAEKRAALLAHLAGLPPAELDKACEAGAVREPAAMGRALALMEAARRRIAEMRPERANTRTSPPSA